MQFNIDIDTDEVVAGWLVPTHPGAVGRIMIVSPGRTPIMLDANIQRPDLVAVGVHATGEAGFAVSKAVVPGLDSMDGLELRDGETGLLIYRRPRPGLDVKLKLARFTQGYGVQSGLDAALARHFSLPYENCGEYPFATLYGLFNNWQCRSIYASGTLSFARHYPLLNEKGFATVMLLREPTAALAETLLAMGAAQRDGEAGTGTALYLDHFASWFAGDDILADDAGLARAFSGLTDAQRLLLTNPAVRLLACDEETPQLRHVAAALEHLADFSLVGVENEAAAFRGPLAELAGGDLLEGFTPARTAEVQALARRLSEAGIAAQLLDLDTMLWEMAQGAVGETA